MSKLSKRTLTDSRGGCRVLPRVKAQSTGVIAVQSRPPAGKQSSSSVLSIIPWAIQNKIQFAKIKPVVLGDSDRGVIATYDISGNECVCSVPAQASLRTYRGCKAVLGVPTDQWQQLPWFAQLALVLLAEVAQGRTSKYADYIAVLPREVDVPVLWTDEELQQLHCQYFMEQVQQQKQEWAALGQQLQHYLQAANLSQQQLYWALAVARSRAFSAPYAAAPLSTAPKLFAAAQVAAAVAYLAQGGTAAVGVEVLGVAAAAGVGLMLLQQPKTQVQHAMCPLLDMFNHDGREQSECELDVWSAAFRVVASRPWQQGQQVFISYGQSSSDVLLQLYGFLEDNNRHERYLVRTLPDALVEHGILTNHQQASNLAEVAFSRQGIPASFAAALEQACGTSKAKVDSSSRNGAGSDALGVICYADLSTKSRSVCAAAISAELQQLAVDPSSDRIILQAFEELPIKQFELADLQQQVAQAQDQLQQLQQQLAAVQEEAAQQQQQVVNASTAQAADAADFDAVPGPEHNSGSSVDNASRVADEMSTDLQHRVNDVSATLHHLQLQQEALQHLISEWEVLTAAHKQLAVRYRFEKHQLLESIVAQLRADS